MAEDPPSPADCARLLLATVPHLMRHVAEVMRQQRPDGGDGPTFGQFLALRLLEHRPHSLKELAAIHHVHPSTMSRSVESLVRRGWVRRAPTPGNRRQVQLTVSERGRAVSHAMQAAIEASVATLMAQLDAAERERVVGGLEVVGRLLAEVPNAETDDPSLR